MSTTETATPIRIRRIEANDSESVAALALQLGYTRSPDAIRSWIESLKSHSEQAAFVACVQNELVATEVVAVEVIAWIEVSIQRHLQSEPFALIGGLVVRDDLRGRGIGRLLCAHVEQWAWDRGIETVRVTSRSTRADAHRFYRDGGYQDTKTSLVFDKARPR